MFDVDIMSKRQSCNGNTLFNYFARSPSVSNSGTKKDEKSSLENETPKKTKEKRPLDTSHGMSYIIINIK